jgi:hypothetical protein
MFVIAGLWKNPVDNNKKVNRTAETGGVFTPPCPSPSGYYFGQGIPKSD